MEGLTATLLANAAQLRPLVPGAFVTAPHATIERAASGGGGGVMRRRGPPALTAATTLPYTARDDTAHSRLASSGEGRRSVREMFGIGSISRDAADGGDASDAEGERDEEADNSSPSPAHRPSDDLRRDLRRPRASVPAPPPAQPPPPAPQQQQPDPVTGLALPEAATVLEDEYVTLEEASEKAREKASASLRRRLERVVGGEGGGEGVGDERAGWLTRYNKCILCAFGNRAIDGSLLGSHLWVELLRLVETFFTSVETDALIGMLDRFYHQNMVPAYREANRLERLPPFNPSAVYEHLTTALHTQNPRLMIANAIRVANQLTMHCAQNMITRTGLMDARQIQSYCKVSELMLKWATSPPSKFAFTAAASATDINPELLTHMTRQQAQEAATKSLAPSTLTWLDDALAAAGAADLATSPLPPDEPS